MGFVIFAIRQLYFIVHLSISPTLFCLISCAYYDLLFTCSRFFVFNQCFASISSSAAFFHFFRYTYFLCGTFTILGSFGTMLFSSRLQPHFILKFILSYVVYLMIHGLTSLLLVYASCILCI
jgi:hypothetical protein